MDIKKVLEERWEEIEEKIEEYEKKMAMEEPYGKEIKIYKGQFKKIMEAYCNGERERARGLWYELLRWKKTAGFQTPSRDGIFNKSKHYFVVLYGDGFRIAARTDWTTELYELVLEVKIKREDEDGDIYTFYREVSSTYPGKEIGEGLFEYERKRSKAIKILTDIESAVPALLSLMEEMKEEEE